jgi:protein-disulfide isomerase
VGDELDQLESKYRRDRYKLTDATLQDMVRDRVLTEAAREQGKTIDEMLLGGAGSLEPSDTDVRTWYDANKARLGGQTLDQLRSRIVDYLRLERRRAAMQKVVDGYQKSGKLVVYLQPYRATFNNVGAPSKGASNSPVTLVEFSDFQCPYCRGFVPTLKRVETEYRDRVRIVYRQYPIPSLHPNASKAAEASLCANEQGKFWELHDLMFVEQDRLSVDDLKTKAQRLGMDRARFDACLDSGKFAQQVDNDVREGTRVGVNGTPAVFVNGVLVDGGAASFETVARALDDELNRVKR